MAVAVAILVTVESLETIESVVITSNYDNSDCYTSSGVNCNKRKSHRSSKSSNIGSNDTSRCGAYSAYNDNSGSI